MASRNWRRASALATALGVTRVVEWFARRPCLLSLNYHRVGDPEADGYDPAVVEATADEFYEQVGLLKKGFNVVDLAEAQEMAAQPSRIRHPQVLITFDDGYRDNHDIALPILRSHGVSAAFFVITGFVGTTHVSWWDQVAFMLRQTKKKVIRLGYPRVVSFDLVFRKRSKVIRDVLRIYKHRDTTDTERLLDEIATECDVPRPRAESRRLFMNWEEVRALLDAGMAIGSHTHRHEILSKLSYEEQLEECRRSRDVIRDKLGITVDSFSYPVGSSESFSDVTMRCLRETGYRTAFSYNGAVNVPPSVAPLNIGRIQVDRVSLPFYRLRVGVATVAGRQLF